MDSRDEEDADGDIDGYTLGSILGIRLGFPDGSALGIFVGRSPGSLLHLPVGGPLGIGDGNCESTKLGSSLGDFDEVSVGILLHLPLGLLDGFRIVLGSADDALLGVKLGINDGTGLDIVAGI